MRETLDWIKQSHLVKVVVEIDGFQCSTRFIPS